jgi:hypothetical protein
VRHRFVASVALRCGGRLRPHFSHLADRIPSVSSVSVLAKQYGHSTSGMVTSPSAVGNRANSGDPTSLEGRYDPQALRAIAARDVKSSATQPKSLRGSNHSKIGTGSGAGRHLRLFLLCRDGRHKALCPRLFRPIEPARTPIPPASVLVARIPSLGSGPRGRRFKSCRPRSSPRSSLGGPLLGPAVAPIVFELRGPLAIRSGKRCFPACRCCAAPLDTTRIAFRNESGQQDGY